MYLIGKCLFCRRHRCCCRVVLDSRVSLVAQFDITAQPMLPTLLSIAISNHKIIAYAPSTGLVNKVVPRLCELASAVSGSQDARYQ